MKFKKGTHRSMGSLRYCYEKNVIKLVEAFLFRDYI
jgi:hypothetical protein